MLFGEQLLPCLYLSEDPHSRTTKAVRGNSLTYASKMLLFSPSKAGTEQERQHLRGPLCAGGTGPQCYPAALQGHSPLWEGGRGTGLGSQVVAQTRSCLPFCTPGPSCVGIGMDHQIGALPPGSPTAVPCFPAKMPHTTSSEDRVLTAPVVADGQPVPGRAVEHNLQAPPHERGGPPPRSLRSSCRAAHTGRKPGAAVRRLLPGHRPLPRLACSLSRGLPGGTKLREGRPHFLGQHSLWTVHLNSRDFLFKRYVFIHCKLHTRKPMCAF